FIVTFVTKQMDATKRNLMVDMTSNPDEPRLVITDTEYSMSESQNVQWFAAGQYAEVYKYDPAILTMSGAYQMLTDDTLRKIRALDRGRLVATVKEFYPDLSAEDLRTFEKRINFLKENAQALRYNGLQGIWN